MSGARGGVVPCRVCGRSLRRTARAGGPAALQFVCRRCGYRLYDYPRACAGMIVVKGDAVLLLRRGEAPKRGFVDIPGGFIEADETPERAARRELAEETGLRVGRIEWLGSYADRYYLRGFGWFPTINFYWLARWRAGRPRAADDAASAEWLPVAKLGPRDGRLAWRHMRRVFRDVRRRLGRAPRAPKSREPGRGARGS